MTTALELDSNTAWCCTWTGFIAHCCRRNNLMIDDNTDDIKTKTEESESKTSENGVNFTDTEPKPLKGILKKPGSVPKIEKQSTDDGDDSGVEDGGRMSRQASDAENEPNISSSPVPSRNDNGEETENEKDKTQPEKKESPKAPRGLLDRVKNLDDASTDSKFIKPDRPDTLDLNSKRSNTASPHAHKSHLEVPGLLKNPSSEPEPQVNPEAEPECSLEVPAISSPVIDPNQPQFLANAVSSVVLSTASIASPTGSTLVARQYDGDVSMETVAGQQENDNTVAGQQENDNTVVGQPKAALVVAKPGDGETSPVTQKKHVTLPSLSEEPDPEPNRPISGNVSGRKGMDIHRFKNKEKVVAINKFLRMKDSIKIAKAAAKAKVVYS